MLVVLRPLLKLKRISATLQVILSFSEISASLKKTNFMTGRMYQDTHFNLTMLNGLPIEQLKVCVNPDDENICLVYLKAEGQPIFEFYLELGFAFCQCWNEYEIDEDDDDYRFDDLTEVWQLKGKHISAIFAEEVAGNSEITFLLEEDEKLLLYYCPTEDKIYFIKDNQVICRFANLSISTSHNSEIFQVSPSFSRKY